jgi:hypothetical protein
MKRIITILAGLMLSAGMQAQTLPPADSTTKKITYTEVVTVTGATKDVLYKRAKNLNISATGIISDKPADGYYSYKGQFKVTYHAPQPGLMHSGNVSYTVTIACKDGRYKYIITDFIHTSDKGNGGALEKSIPECNKYVLTLQGWGDIKKQTATEMEKLASNIKSGMANPNDKPVGDGKDW